MDTGVRLQRYVVSEIGELFGLKPNVAVSTLIVIVVTLALSFSTGADGDGGMVIWPLFGTTNQLMAALTLSILAVMLTRKRRPITAIILPLLFILVMTLLALITQLGQYWSQQKWLLLGLDAIILVCAVWVVLEAALALTRARNEPEDDETPAESTTTSAE